MTYYVSSGTLNLTKPNQTCYSETYVVFLQARSHVSHATWSVRHLPLQLPLININNYSNTMACVMSMWPNGGVFIAGDVRSRYCFSGVCLCVCLSVRAKNWKLLIRNLWNLVWTLEKWLDFGDIWPWPWPLKLHVFSRVLDVFPKLPTGFLMRPEHSETETGAQKLLQDQEQKLRPRHLTLNFNI